MRIRAQTAFLLVTVVCTSARAQSVTDASPVTFNGYAEAYYQWNVEHPDNGLTNFRGFDNRHNTFTLSNVALGASWDWDNVIGQMTLQVGSTPSTYYLAEPAHPGAGGANGTDADLWKYIQQAYVGYRFDVGRPLTVTAGIFLSPIGPESMAVRDNWNWSRSNLFFGLPFYHTGLRAQYAFTDQWMATLAVYNGWNSVVDNNDGKSVSAQITFTRADVVGSVLYFGGIERAAGSPEGQPWRHLIDAHLTWNATPWLSLLLHGDGGLEANDFGTSGWLAGALYGRVALQNWLYFAARGDVFLEHVAKSDDGRAAPIFWPAPWVASVTGTVDVRPGQHVSFRLEYRHDSAGGAMYFGDDVMGDGSAAAPYVANRRHQDTVTLGATAWF